MAHPPPSSDKDEQPRELRNRRFAQRAAQDSFLPRLLGLLRLQRDVESDLKTPEELSEAYDKLINQFDHLHALHAAIRLLTKRGASR